MWRFTTQWRGSAASLGVGPGWGGTQACGLGPAPGSFLDRQAQLNSTSPQARPSGRDADYLVWYLQSLAVDLLNPSAATTEQTHKLKRLVQSPNSFFMDVKCPGKLTLKLACLFRFTVY